MEEALRTILLTAPGVSALVGTRVDWGERPQGDALPGIRLNVINDGPVDYSLDGPGLSQARVQVDCFGATYASAKVLSRAVRAALDTYAGGTIQGIFLAGTRDLPSDDGTATIFAVSADFIVNHHN